MGSSLACEVIELSELARIEFSPAELELANQIPSQKRREQFLLGRAAAHAALTTLPPEYDSEAPILRGADGEPLWPSGVVGSIAHTEGAGIAVVGLAEEFESLGVDIEPASRTISDGAIKKITLPAERVWVDESKAQRRLRALQVFCAKESIYKAYHPLCHKRLTFKDAFVRWEEEHQAFVGTLLTDLNEIHQAGDLVAIHCTVGPSFVMCCTVMPRLADA
jgi:4'-phosphopantetheinyl transferase EntD